MKRLLLLMVLCSAYLVSFGQERQISGKVVDNNGESLPGVNVVLKGTTNGTITDIDGNYKFNISADGGTLLFSFIGMTTQEVEIGARSVIDVSMTADATELSEVVVTALGTKQNANEVVYANQTVNSEELLSAPNKNALEALRGKVAGVNLTTASGSVGASTRIVLRGAGSLTGNNNALIVIDGIAIDNSATRGDQGGTTAGSATSGYADHGSRLSDINPEDIESLTILKGPSATSLYGSRGASGVVLITTKKGGANKNGNMQVNFTSSYSIETAKIFLERQNQFGQGFDNASFDTGENWSWGPAVDGVVRPWTSPIDADGDGKLEWLTRPYSAVPNQIEDFFNAGRTASNSLSLQGGNEGFSYYLSYSNFDQKGILDNTRYKRNTFTISASAKLSDRIKSDFKLSYANVKQNTAQEGSRAFEGNNAYAMVLQSPITIPFNEVRDYNSPYHDINGYWGSYSSVNPYYILNEFGNDGKINNFLGNASITYNVLEGLDITGRVGTNMVSTEIETWTPKFTPDQQIVWADNVTPTTRNTRHISPGDYSYFHRLTKNVDLSALASYSKDLNNNFGLSVTAGYNFFQRDIEDATGQTFGGLLVPGLYSLGNSTLAAQASLDRSQYRIYGILGNARLAFKNAVFLEYSARNDWSSTLPENNNKFFYQAIGLSAVVTDLVEMDNSVLSFLKVRTSIGSTGKDAPLYVLNSSFNGNPGVFVGSNPVTFPLGAQPASSVGNQIGSPNLTPEKTITQEYGADISLFDERVSIEYTYYSSQHNDQIVTVSLPRTSGFRTTTLNIGKMTNKGHELSLRLRPIHGLVDGLDLELFGTYSKNTNEVVKISDEVDELSFGTYTPGVTLVAKEGLPYGSFKALAPRTNAAGQTIVDPNTGFPLYTDQEVFLGSNQANFRSNFGANIRYKNFGFNVLFDLKDGGKFVSQSKFFTEFNGTAIHTAEHNREPFVVPNSVTANADGSFTANTIQVTEQNYFTSYDPAASTYIIDGSFLKLREMGITYDIPKSIVNKLSMTSARIEFFGKNLKFWFADENNFADAEVGGSAQQGNAIGFETAQTPTQRSIGVRFSAKF